MASLNIFIGSDIFRILRQGKYCYVDKTGFIEELLGANQAQVSLITRPRRFGKTLMLTMLQEFFDVRAKDRNLFGGLAIAENKTLCEAWMHQYPTLFLTLKGVEGRDMTLPATRWGNSCGCSAWSMTICCKAKRLSRKTRKNWLLSKKAQGRKKKWPTP